MNECRSLHINNNNKKGKKNKCPLIILPPHLISLNANTNSLDSNTNNNKNKWKITSAEKADEFIFSKIKTKNGTSNVSLIEKLNYSNPIHKKTLILTSTNSRGNSKENNTKHLRILSKPLHVIMKNKEDFIIKDPQTARKKKMLSLYQSPAQKMHCTSIGFNSNFYSISSSVSPQNLKAKLLKPIKAMSNPDIERIKEVLSAKTAFPVLTNYSKTYLFYYKIGPVIGRGAFGKINVCLHILSNQLVAIKSFNKKHKKFSYDKILEEVHLMKVLTSNSNSNASNPIVDFFELFETEFHLCIVMEYVNGNDLLSLVKKKRLNEKKAKYIFLKLVLGIKEIHAKRIAHRDIKLENILIGEDSRVKICDLGIAKIIEKQGQIFKDRCGTLNYIAPEIIKGKGYNGEFADIWSCGIVLYTMLFGKLPYKFDKEAKKIDYATPPDYSKISIQVRDLIQKLLVIDRPEKRMTLINVLSHQWLFNVTKISLFGNREKEYFKLRWDEDETDFKEENIKTIDADQKDMKNKKTKSLILAPFNSENDDKEEDGDGLNKKTIKDSIVIVNERKIMMYEPNAKEDNLNYMLNNNNDADNGVYANEDKNENEKEMEESVLESERTQTEAQTINIASSYSFSSKTTINNVLGMMEEYGYQGDYVLNCIQKKEFNHATTTYTLLVKRLLFTKKSHEKLI